MFVTHLIAIFFILSPVPLIILMKPKDKRILTIAALPIGAQKL